MKHNNGQKRSYKGHSGPVEIRGASNNIFRAPVRLKQVYGGVLIVDPLHPHNSAGTGFMALVNFD